MSRKAVNKESKEPFWSPVSNKELCKHLLSNALEEIGHEVDKRIHRNVAEYKRRGKEDHLLKMFRKKAAKICRKKQHKESVRGNDTRGRNTKNRGTGRTTKKNKNTHKSVIKKKKTACYKVIREPLVLENDYFRNVRNSLDFFAKKKKEFLLSVLGLYKEMEALDLTDLKTILEMKFMNMKNKEEAELESGDTIPNKMMESSKNSLRTAVEGSASVSGSERSSSSVSSSVVTERALASAVASRKPEVVKTKSKFNISAGILKNSVPTQTPESQVQEFTRHEYPKISFKKPPKKTYG